MVKDFSENVSRFNEVLYLAVNKAYGTLGMPFSKEYILWPRGSFGQELAESLAWLGKEAGRHASVDTYAKKLFIRNDKEAQVLLHKLKTTLSCYLLLEQSLSQVDKRYDSFFASILTRRSKEVPSLPRAVSIVTWNYDTQLEKSYKEFCEDPSSVDEGITKVHNIIRLNGVCGLPHRIEARDLCYTDFSKSFFESVLKLFRDHIFNAIGCSPGISFAWEKRDLDAMITEVIKGTTTLVIIGYSLPYFNRDIDRTLFEIMAPTLEKIFIQVPQSEHSGVKERFLTLCKDESVKNALNEKIKMLAGIDLFYIPDNMPG
jgi:hypothetical protein